MKLSIIVPIYNAEEKLHIMMDSLIQSNLDFEIICVNDGSTDNSGFILEKYNDERIKIYTKENEGTFKAWHYGVTKATGEYIAVFDCDDYIDGNYIDYIFTFIDQVNADVLFTCYYIEKDNIDLGTSLIGIEDGIYSGENLSQIRPKLLSATVPYGKPTKVIRKSIIEDQIRNTYQGRIGDFEDWLTMIEVFENIDSIQICNKAFYHYIQYSDSVSKSSLSYEKNYESFQIIYNYLSSKKETVLTEKNLESIYFYGLNSILNRCISIGERNLANRILNDKKFHSFIFKSRNRLRDKFLFYTKNIDIYFAMRDFKRFIF